MTSFKYFLLFICFTAILTSEAQSVFQKQYTTADDSEYPGFAALPDGSYLLAFGQNRPDERTDACLIMLNGNGDTLWTRFYGGSEKEYFTAVAPCSDGGFIAAGNIYDTLSGNDVFLARADPEGVLEWSAEYQFDGQEYVTNVMETSDGGFLIAGQHNDYSEIFFIKTNSIGDTLWTKYSSDWLFMCGISEKDNEYLIAVINYSTFGDGIDGMLISVSSEGEVVSARDYGGVAGITAEYFEDMIKTMDGNFVFAGTIYNTGFVNDIWLCKINGAGDVLWSKRIYAPEIHSTYSVNECSDRSFLITGEANDRYYIVKTDSTGNALWGMEYLNTDFDAWPHMIRYVGGTSDGGLILAGATDNASNHATVLKTDYAGYAHCADSVFDLTTEDYDLHRHNYAFHPVAFPVIKVTGPSQSYNGGIVINTICESDVVEEIQDKDQVAVFPNPASEFIYITDQAGHPLTLMKSITIYDMMGKDVREYLLPQNEISISGIASGMYLVRITDQKGNTSTTELEIVRK